jgi:hypothetical protein
MMDIFSTFGLAPKFIWVFPEFSIYNFQFSFHFPHHPNKFGCYSYFSSYKEFATTLLLKSRRDVQFVEIGCFCEHKPCRGDLFSTNSSQLPCFSCFLQSERFARMAGFLKIIANIIKSLSDIYSH